MRASSGRDVPTDAAAILRPFYAPFAASVRRELRLLRQPVRSAREDPWLWADEGVRSTVVTRAAAAATATATAIGNSPPPDTTPPDTTPPDTTPPDTTPPDTTLPSVFLLGGEKCGSTSLAFALSRHPQVLRHLIGMGFVT